MEHNRKSLKNKETNNKINNFIKYTSLAFEMMAIIMLCVLAGIELDKMYQCEFKRFTLILSLIGVFAAIYFAIKDFLKKQ